MNLGPLLQKALVDPVKAKLSEQCARIDTLQRKVTRLRIAMVLLSLIVVTDTIFVVYMRFVR